MVDTYCGRSVSRPGSVCALVREVAAPDVGSMGIEILSFTIKDVSDDVEYLSSLGKSQTEDADVGVAQAGRDAGIRESECQKSAMDVKYSTDTKVEDCFRVYKLQQAAFDREINTAKAEAALAYELSAAKVSQKLKQEEKMGDVIERKKMVEIEEQEVQRKERDLVLPLNYQLKQKLSAFKQLGKRTETLEVARAEAERIRKIGQAEAEAIVMVGKAESEAMKARAGAYAGFGNAGVCAMVTEALPLIAAEIAAPLARVEEITIIGGNQDNSTLVGELTKAIGSLNPAIKGLTGIDVAAALGQKYGAEQKGQRSK
ncbi:Flotillin-2 [Orchesella cincta]|uniref:Flotillin-2 n=1 Tax=Orchesella cincta TaxID=48709 RepID=A0A1D2M2Z0_ORCCI|nr:Flotillin-2 [Orchesella cincta]